jgi:hypothetical protein
MLMKTQVLIISCHDVDENKRESFQAGTEMAPGPRGKRRQIGHHQGTKTRRKIAEFLSPQRHGGTEAVEHLPNRPQITQILQMAGEKSVKSA